MMNYRRSALVRRIALARALPTQTAGSIDEAAFVDGFPKMVKHFSESDVPRGAPYFVRGWAIDLGRKQVPWALHVEIDGRPIQARIRAAEPRPDIARRFGTERLTCSGFTAFVDTKALAVGPHVLRIRAVVGRYGAAFARLSDSVHFHVHVAEKLAVSEAPRAPSPLPAASFTLDQLRTISQGGVLVLGGRALDLRKRKFSRVAAQVDEDGWHWGWITSTGLPAGTQGEFGVRVPLDTLVIGEHRVRIAAQNQDGAWFALGGARRLIVSSACEAPSKWRRPIADGGTAEIAGSGGMRATRIEYYRVRSPVLIEGTLRRATSVGLPVRLVARDADSKDFTIPGWSARADERSVVTFGAELTGDVLAPGVYRLFIDAADGSRRFVGRADTRCNLVVARRPPLGGEGSSPGVRKLVDP